MPDFYDIPKARAEITDYGTRVTPPPVGPKVLIIGTTDAPGVQIEEPTALTRFEDRTDYNNADGKPSELTKKTEEVMQGRARNVEVFVISDGAGGRFKTSELSSSARYAMMDRAYEILLDHDADIIVTCGTAVDMTGLTATQNFAYQLANFCYQATKEFNCCRGVIGVQPPSLGVAGSGDMSLVLQSAWVTALQNFDTEAFLGINFAEYDGVSATIPGATYPDSYAFWATTDEVMPVGLPPCNALNVRKDAKGNPIDIGGYISVVAPWTRFRNECAQMLNPTVGYYNASAEGLYAGLMSTLPPENGTTNNIVPGGEALRNLSARQVNGLNDARFVVFHAKPKGYVVSKDVTGAHNIDDYRRSDFVLNTTVAITQEAIGVARQAVDPFLGLPINGPNRSAADNALDHALERMQQRGALQGFRFSIITTPTMMVLNQAIIDLTIVPAFELLDVRVRVGLSSV